MRFFDQYKRNFLSNKYFFILGTHLLVFEPFVQRFFNSGRCFFASKNKFQSIFLVKFCELNMWIGANFEISTSPYYTPPLLFTDYNKMFALIGRFLNFLNGRLSSFLLHWGISWHKFCLPTMYDTETKIFPLLQRLTLFGDP